jgi:hypothetical protein
MKQSLGVLLLPALAALLLAILSPGTGEATAPDRPFAPFQPPIRGPDAAPPPPVIEARLPAPPPDSPRPSEALTDCPGEEVVSILEALAGIARSGAPIFPEPEIEALRACLDRRPEIADLVIAALESAEGQLRAFLAHAIYRLGDRVLKERLILVLRKTAPGARRIAADRQDPGLLAGALSPERDPRERLALLARLGPPDLADAGVFLAVLAAARSDPDPGIRAMAISRLTGTTRPEARDLLHELVRNRSASPSDRRAALSALRLRPDDRTGPALLDVLGSEEDPALVRLAALGLGRASDRIPAARGLADLLTDAGADDFARRNASLSLVDLLASATGDEAARIEAIVFAACQDLARDAASGSLLDEITARVPVMSPGRYDGPSGSPGDTMIGNGGVR